MEEFAANYHPTEEEASRWVSTAVRDYQDKRIHLEPDNDEMMLKRVFFAGIGRYITKDHENEEGKERTTGFFINQFFVAYRNLVTSLYLGGNLTVEDGYKFMDLFSVLIGYADFKGLTK